MQAAVRTLWRAVCCSLVLAGSADAQIRSVHIDVDGEPAGKGVAITRGLDCFVLTALHVVEKPLPIRMVGESMRSSTGTVTWRDGEADLAVIDVERDEALCGRDAFIRVADLAERIRLNQTGVLRVRSRQGREDDVPVRIVRLVADSIVIQPRDPRQPLGQGYSGSMLYVAGEPAGVLLEVFTDGSGGGRAYPVDWINERIGEFLPLVQPPEEAARYDEALAADLLRKNINYMRTPAFCRSLLTRAKWISKPEGQVTYTQRSRDSRGDTEYHVDSWLFPEKHSVLTVNADESRHELETRVGFVTATLGLREVWGSAEDAIDDCIKSDLRRELKLAVREWRRPGEIRKDTRWSLERTGFMGFRYTPSVQIWLTLEANEIAIRIWSRE